MTENEAFEQWLDAVAPLGNVSTIINQWRNSFSYAEWLTNSSVTAPVPTAEVETTVPTTAMVGGSVLAAGPLVGVASVALSASEYEEMMSQTMVPTWPSPTIHAQIFPSTLSNFYTSTMSVSQQLYNMDLDTPPTSTNSSMNTKTKKAEQGAFKPVILTMTGQLKPSTLTVDQPAKSAQSTKRTPPTHWTNNITGQTTVVNW